MTSPGGDPTNGTGRNSGEIFPAEAAWPEIHRVSAFTDRADGGNPAGVVITDRPLGDAVMQRIARHVGYSETAFLVPAAGELPHAARRHRIRYFSPEAEVAFCGHASIASGIVLGQRSGAASYELITTGGPVKLEVRSTGEGFTATLTSVRPYVEAVTDGLVDAALSALGWVRGDLDPAFVPEVAFAGVRHLVLVARTRSRLADLAYDFDRLRTLMEEHELTTVALLFREDGYRIHARNPFPPGGVLEDPATGAAAAAVGAYLRAHGHVEPPATVEILQGVDMGRPSLLTVHIPVGEGGIHVTGTGVEITER